MPARVLSGVGEILLQLLERRLGVSGLRRQLSPRRMYIAPPAEITSRVVAWSLVPAGLSVMYAWLGVMISFFSASISGRHSAGIVWARATSGRTATPSPASSDGESFCRWDMASLL